MRVDTLYQNMQTARWSGATSNDFGLRDRTGLTLEQVKADATAGKIEICYTLAEPITFHVDPQEIKSLKGNNTVWSSGGQVKVVV